MITRRATNNDVEGILELQEKNLFENMSEPEKENGFVTTPFTTALLQELLDCHGLFIAESEGRILGYAMAASWDYFSQWPIFPFMMSRLSGFVFNGTSVSDQNSFQYGPICIDSTLRGTDAFPRLFDEMRRELTKRYPIGITFINKLNNRSYAAHTGKLGMVVIDEFEFSGRQYYGLAFETDLRILPRRSSDNC